MKAFPFKLVGLLVLFCFYGRAGQAQNFAKWEKEIAAFEQADKTNPPQLQGIVFTGSSSIRLWEGLKQDFPNKNILNRGFGGCETDAVAYFTDRIVWPYKPKQVVIYVGDNDLAAGKSPQKVLADFKELFFKIRKKDPQTIVTFISIKPSPSRMHILAGVRDANRLIKGFLASQQKTSYVDVFTPMLLPSGKPRPALFRSDSLHMTRAGYDIWAATLRPYLK